MAKRVFRHKFYRLFIRAHCGVSPASGPAAGRRRVGLAVLTKCYQRLFNMLITGAL